tara:strand:+ start:2193 stop:2867 length:675 start_codon:yes stop_codon:yes gene_type:complete
MTISIDSANLPMLIHQAAFNPHQDLNSFNESCDLAKHFSLGGFCTDLSMIPLARKRLGGEGISKLIATIAFPFGSIPLSLKKSQAEWAASQGAEELEVVPNFFLLYQENKNLFAEELASICDIGLPVRAIINSTSISQEVLSTAIEASIDAGVIGIQSTNGFGKAITSDEIHKIKHFTKGRCSIKAVGGIKTLQQTISLIEAGADFIGTSLGYNLIKEMREKKQ